MSEIRKPPMQDLEDAVHGDLQAFSRLQYYPHEEIRQVQDEFGELTVTVEDVRRVLLALLEQEISPEQAQAWAFFVRQGFVGIWKSRPITEEARSEVVRSGARLRAIWQAVPTQHSGRPIRTLDITYDASREDSIADAVARLDDIATVGANITESEIKGLLGDLGSRSGEG